MSWNYRVVETTQDIEHGGVYIRYAIHEVYYDSEDKIKSWTVEPTWPEGETYVEFREAMTSYMSAVWKPALIESTLPGNNHLRTSKSKGRIKP